MIYVIVHGDLLEGIKGIMGIWDDEEEAIKYMETHNFGHYDQFVVEMELIATVNME